MPYNPPITVPASDPSIRAIIAATFPTYRRKTVQVEVAESVTFYDLNWSGGTRAEYAACTMPVGAWESRALGSSANWHRAAPWANKAEGATVPTMPGSVIVKGGDFCGKPAMLRIYVNPADMPRLLPAPR